MNQLNGNMTYFYAQYHTYHTVTILSFISIYEKKKGEEISKRNNDSFFQITEKQNMSKITNPIQLHMGGFVLY